ncbi:MAG TPA: type II secretion system protein [Sedimentisphaerales bacterium]|jgi:type II secretory pathway pseudopilin PulG|nr:type II secretion system protein [Sedimentisphaerales bacterium]HNU30563.1 type II secretion system protein [Sedimentisphaerales bacterium]
MSTLHPAQKRDSSLLEVGVVVATLMILASVSIPQMSQGARNTGDLTLDNGLAALRNAIDLYSIEHGGALPTAARIEAQLTQYTDLAGNVSATRTPAHLCGPYLDRIPVLPASVRKGSSRIAPTDAQDVGWLYTEATGQITANTAGPAAPLPELPTNK